MWFGSLWSLLEVSQSCKILHPGSNDAVVSLLSADMLELYLVVRFYTSVMNLHLRHASLSVSCLREKRH